MNRTAAAQTSPPASVAPPLSDQEAQLVAPPLSDQEAFERLPDELRLRYYDEARDLRAQTSYYHGFSTGSEPDVRTFRRLQQLLGSSHRQRGYNPSKNLFPWVDLRPSFRLQSLYTNAGRASNDPIRVGSADDFKEKVASKKAPQGWRYTGRNLEEKAAAWAETLLESPTDAVRLAGRIAKLETESYFNCEHVVAQITFDYKAPMVGDLHHTFTCESEANAFRSSLKFFDFAEYEPEPGDEGGVANERLFEPAAGKGAVARAIFYFRTRYPDQFLPYGKEDYQTLLKWHEEDPPGVWERHRNQEIQKIQGNRNPYIDFPEWAQRFVPFMN